MWGSTTFAAGLVLAVKLGTNEKCLRLGQCSSKATLWASTVNASISQAELRTWLPNTTTTYQWVRLPNVVLPGHRKFHHGPLLIILSHNVPWRAHYEDLLQKTPWVKVGGATIAAVHASQIKTWQLGLFVNSKVSNFKNLTPGKLVNAFQAKHVSHLLALNHLIHFNVIVAVVALI